MAALATVAAADLRAQAKGPSGDNTWLYAFGSRTFAGAPCVRVMRYMTAAFTEGLWVELTDDGAT